MSEASPSEPTGFIAAETHEDSDVLPGFLEGRSQITESSNERRRLGWGFAGAFVAGLAVLALIAVLVGIRIAHRDAADATSGKTAVLAPAGGEGTSAAESSSPSGPGSVKAANRQHGRAQASTIADYLRRSGQVRHNVSAAISAISGCTNVASAVNTLHNAASVRTGIRTALANADFSALHHGTAAVADLRRAMRASASADRQYAAWGQAVAGCHRHAPRTAEFDTALRSDTAATAAKRRFVDKWNPIAARYGLAKQSANTI